MSCGSWVVNIPAPFPGPRKPSTTKFAYYLTMSYFGQVIGKYYGETYFGPAAKADVEHMVHQMIAVYKQRLEENDWLSPATRQKAIVKLEPPRGSGWLPG